MVIVDPWKVDADIASVVGRLPVSSARRSWCSPPTVAPASLPRRSRPGSRATSARTRRPQDLIRAIEAARAGEFYVDPGLSSTIVLDEADRTLSARQREILQMLADGMQTDAVAERLGLSTETVRTHTKRILAKLEASTRTQAVAIGIRHGMID